MQEQEESPEEWRNMVAHRRGYLRLVMFLPALVLLPMILVVVVIINAFMGMSGEEELYLWKIILHVMQLALTGMSITAVIMVTRQWSITKTFVDQYMGSSRGISLTWWFSVLTLLLLWAISDTYYWWTGSSFDSVWNQSLFMQAILMFVGMVVAVMSIPLVVVIMSFWGELAHAVGANHSYSKLLTRIGLNAAWIIGLLIGLLLSAGLGSVMLGMILGLLVGLLVLALVVVILIFAGAYVTWQAALACWKDSLEEMEQWGMKQVEEKEQLSPEGSRDSWIQ